MNKQELINRTKDDITGRQLVLKHILDRLKTIDKDFDQFSEEGVNLMFAEASIESAVHELDSAKAYLNKVESE